MTVHKLRRYIRSSRVEKLCEPGIPFDGNEPFEERWYRVTCPKCLEVRDNQLKYRGTSIVVMSLLVLYGCNTAEEKKIDPPGLYAHMEDLCTNSGIGELKRLSCDGEKCKIIILSCYSGLTTESAVMSERDAFMGMFQ